MSFEILELPQEEIDAACALFSGVYGHPIEPGQWRWKYLLGPRLGQVNMAARSPDGQWVGHAGAIVFPGSWQGRAMPMAQVCDIMVDRRARGGLSREGVYPRLVAALREALRTRYPGVYAYGFPGERPFRLGERIGFYRRLYQCREASIPLDAPAASGAWAWSARPLDWQQAEALLDRAWSRLGPQQPVPMVARTGAWLAWRYRDHPGHAYRLWMLRHWFGRSGWLVTRAMPDGALCVVDALLPRASDAPAACSALRIELTRETAGGGAVLSTWLDVPGAADTPIVGTEFLAERWHTDLPAPKFQPGDTDVY
ncbi:GNAT family N-acetyltransferase [Quisquiliibacterium transsilvanicum]|uniref:GNAT family N-acetyltransferase n=1 Tax=Quisquiliibacterium transsilvanicum TaxID=1549638 RepID=A0A7W8MA24_9BURK|nr:GNAT family N-acetyltransferase [Quisquiliibacterium transsilvanicum]MBB5273493.1 hypothetical protein [Quisquiliibacterium transsilvanicum]